MTERKAPEFDPKDVRGLLYEYRMLVATSRLWIEGAEQPDSPVDFAVLESFLVHARNLHEFLRSRKEKEKDRRPGDYFASDFVDGFEFEVYDKATVEKINRWLQHLTTWRYEDDKHPEWSLPKLLAPVVEAMGAFLGVLETESDKASALIDCHDSAKPVMAQLPN